MMDRSRWDWFDFDQSESRYIREFLKQDVEGDGTDPLRIGSSVRDKLSERLFPGTSTQFTRLRYVILSAAMLCEPRAGSADLAKRQHLLNGKLCRANPNETGVIGRRNPEREFVTLYWTALHTWGLLIPNGDKRNLTVANGRAAFASPGPSDDDGTPISEDRVRWDPPAARLAHQFWARRNEAGWPSIHCTRAEVNYLLGRWSAQPPNSLMPMLAHQVRTGVASGRSPLTWASTFDQKLFPEARLEVDRALAVSFVCWSALLAYNLALLRQAQLLDTAGVQGAWRCRDGILSRAENDLEGSYRRWQSQVEREANRLGQWVDRGAWASISPKAPAEFLAASATLLVSGHVDLRSKEWVRHVGDRERWVNAEAKLGDDIALAGWTGTPEMSSRWDFRWDSGVRRLVEDAGSPHA